jgi:hypothetical protein
MTTLDVVTTLAILWTWIQVQEWRELTRNNRYAVKLGKAKPNERKVGAA